MVGVTVGNSTCSIVGLGIKYHKALGRLLSYRVKAGASRTFLRSLLTKKGSFPTGLLYIVRQYLKDAQIKASIRDLRIRPKSLPGRFKLSLPYTPYPEQREAAQACLRAYRGIVSAPTALGKSIIAALIIDSLQVRTLVVVPSLELKRQLLESLRQYFGQKAVSGDVYSPLGITVENVDALDPKFDISPYFDAVIIDEFHHSGAATYRKLNKDAWKGVFYKFGLTATPFRSQDEERLLLESVLSRVIYRVTHKTAVEKGYIVPIEAYYYELPKRQVEGYLWAEVYKELVVERDDRNALIAKVLRLLKAQGVATLCLVKEIKHGDLLSDKSQVLFANGQDEETRSYIKAFSLGKLGSLIGTTGVLGEGIDTKPAEYIWIAGLGKSKNALMQQFGRGFRLWPGKESCKILLIRDPSHKWTRAHYRAQCKILLDEYNVKPVRLELPEDL